ncbi:MAG: transporter substrate-binding domain-containing protein, partial [Mycetocola sp.]
ERRKAVDFSSPYFVTTQAVVATSGTAFADATTAADLKGAKIGVASGSTSLDSVTEAIDPTEEVQVFNSNDDAIQALNAGQIDALVTDLPTSFFIVDSGQVTDGKIVGQLDGSTSGGDELAILLPKDSPLTEKVTAAADTLRDNGTLDAIAEEWLAEQGAPVLG